VKGKNIHRIIYSIREELDDINPALFDLYDYILKTNERMDWAIPPEIQKQCGKINQNISW